MKEIDKENRKSPEHEPRGLFTISRNILLIIVLCIQGLR